MLTPVACVNGEFVARDAARVSVMDRGFLFGDAVYEVIPVYAGQPFRLDAHLARLTRSLGEIGMDNPLSATDWRAMIDRLITDNKLADNRLDHDQVNNDHGGDGSLYLQVTRGAPDVRDHWPQHPMQPTVVAFTGKLQPVSDAVRTHGVAVITRDDPRWQRCDIKTTALLANVLGRREAAAAGAVETLFHRRGQLTEGAATNIFIVRDDTVITPELGPHLLAGITRDALLDYLDETGTACAQATVSLADLRAADEVWLTSSTREIVPVTRCDGVAVGNGSPGPVWQSVQPGFAHWLRTDTHPAPPTTLMEHG